MKVNKGQVLVGAAGTATEVIVSGRLSRPDWAASLATWFLDCPGQSPFWRHYRLTIIHLRDIPGVPPADIRIPGATHEVMLMALDPGAKPRWDKLKSWKFLTPVNVVEQIELPNDDAAGRLLVGCAHAVVNGILPAEPPLSGQVEPWRTVLIKTAAHERGEAHAP